MRKAEKTLDLTEGSVWKRLLQYALPFVAISLMQSLYSMADLMISGHFIGARGISGINNSSLVMELLTKIIIGLSQGGNILIGQFFGAGEEEKRKETTNTLFYSFAVMSVVLVGVVSLSAGVILRALGAPAYQEALAYLRICSLGIFFIAGYNALVAAVRGVGDSKRPMKIILIATGANIILDLLFVGGIHMGTKGAALATVISQGISFGLLLAHVLRNPDIFGIRLSMPEFHAKRFCRIVALGIPCAVQMSLAAVSWLTVTKFVNGYGVTASAGAGVSAKIKDLCQLFISAVSSAASTMVAQTLGAGKLERAKEVLYTAMKLTCVAAFALILVVEAGAPAFAGFFTGDLEAVKVAALNLRIEIIGQIFYAVFMIYHGFAIGAGHTWFVLLSSFVNCILVRAVLVVILERILGLSGIFLACMVAPGASVPLGMVYVRSGVWKKELAYE
ncbi:MAG: MATE family efflux transporter [Dorea sp.]|jgi:putative MATE family efflux protein|nr:MATE family efflux transporter [Dorea sp.]